MTGGVLLKMTLNSRLSFLPITASLPPCWSVIERYHTQDQPICIPSPCHPSPGLGGQPTPATRWQCMCRWGKANAIIGHPRSPCIPWKLSLLSDRGLLELRLPVCACVSPNPHPSSKARGTSSPPPPASKAGICALALGLCLALSIITH